MTQEKQQKIIDSQKKKSRFAPLIKHKSQKTAKS